MNFQKLLFVGTAAAYADIDRPLVPRKTSNATGDEIDTDGKISRAELARAKAPGDTAPALAPRPPGAAGKATSGGR